MVRTFKAGAICGYRKLIYTPTTRQKKTRKTYQFPVPLRVLATAEVGKRPGRVAEHADLVVLAEEGIRAFYGGLSAHLMRVIPNAAVMYSIYEAALRWDS